MLDKLKELQKLMSDRPEPSDLIVHIDDTLLVLREFRDMGYILERGITVSGKKASYWNVKRDFGFAVFKIMVNTYRNTPRGSVIVVPHKVYKFGWNRDIQIKRGVEVDENNLFNYFRYSYGYK